MLELFYSPGACSLAPHIALEEAGAQFELRRYAIADGENRSAEYLAINPNGRVPALREGNWILLENPAVLVYIARRHPGSRLLPDNAHDAASCESLLAYFCSSVHIAFAQYFRPERFTDEVDLLPRMKDNGLRIVRAYFGTIETMLGGDWLVANRFSVADLYPLVFFRWGIRIGIDMNAYPRWTAHTERMLARPAVQRAMAREQITMGPPRSGAVIAITGYDHVGIRVVDRERALRFYAALGFRSAGHADVESARAVDLINAAGVRINLICNGQPPPGGRNVLMDFDDKWPGITHPAFIVDDLEQVLRWAAEHAVPITEGPVFWEGRRRVCFLRDPDGNVLEFDELVNDLLPHRAPALESIAGTSSATQPTSP